MADGVAVPIPTFPLAEAKITSPYELEWAPPQSIYTSHQGAYSQYHQTKFKFPHPHGNITLPYPSHALMVKS